MRDSFCKIAADRRAAVARQVRTSTGFTWSPPGAVATGPRLEAGWRSPAVAVRPGPALPGPGAAAVRSGTGMERLMRALASWPADRPLARTPELAEIAGLVRADMTPATVSSRLTAALNAAQRAGLIEVFAQAIGRHRGERAVWVRADGRVLATEAAPAVWGESLRTRAAAAAALVGG
jgi:hypothetical protein